VTSDLQIISFDIQLKKSDSLSMEALGELLLDPNYIFWIHCDINDPKLQKIKTTLLLDETFNEFINDDSSIPRIDDSETSLTLKIQAPQDLNPVTSKSDVYVSLVMHITNRFCLTVSDGPVPALQEFALHYEKSLRYAETPCFILFLILDNILNDYAEILFLLETVADEMDFTVRSSHKDQYRKVNKVKKHLLKTKRFSSAIRDILMRISGRKIGVISNHCRKSLLDLYSHSQVIVSESDSIREILNGLLDQIDNALIFRMSETMKVLTAFAAIFLPLTLITGIYGMNFKSMPELEWEYGYFTAIGFIVVCGLSLFFYFKHKKWI
jgi:magnesium transporter